MSYSRFAIYYVPPAGVLASFGARWLGWDVISGSNTEQPDIAGLDDVTMTPRKYGFHGTLKPPFRLAKGFTPEALTQAVSDVAKTCKSAKIAGLELSQLGRFLALTPQGNLDGLAAIAQACVTELDAFRAAPDAAELDRRRASGLSAPQENNLVRWGYPYVLSEFQFHLTLTGKLPEEALPVWHQIVQKQLPPLPRPFLINAITLVGEREDGCFEVIHRYPLTG